MGNVWIGTANIGTFTPQIEGTSGNVYLDAANIGSFTLASEGWVYADSKEIGVYVAIKLNLAVPQCLVKIYHGSDTWTPINTGDVVNSLTVTLSLLSKGINGAILTLPNFDGEWNGKISVYDDIIIWLSRDPAELGTDAGKIFAGKIVNVGKSAAEYGGFFIDLECHGYCHEMMSAAGLLKTLNEAVNGRTIIEDAVDLCPKIVKHSTASKWFDNAGASGDIDDRIGSTHDLDFSDEGAEIIPLTVIQQILEKAKNPGGIVGFDMYEVPASGETKSGVLIGHLRNSLDFESPVASVIPRTYQQNIDVHRVKNKIKVYGVAQKAYPIDRDSITEILTLVGNTLEHADGTWTVGGAGSTISKDTDEAKGTYSVMTSGGTKMELIFTFDTGKYVNANLYPNLTVQLKPAAGYPYFTIQLEDSSAQIVRRHLQISDGEWGLHLWGCGRKHDDEWEASVFNSQPFDWENVKILTFSISGGGADFRVDNLFFNNRRFSGSSEDSASQTAYGVCEPEPIIDDSLESDAECLKLANSIRDFRKNPVTTLTNVLVDGDQRYAPGDLQFIVVVNDLIMSYFRIIQLSHEVYGATWDATLTLSDEPSLIESVFRSLKKAQKLLERRD